MKNLKLGINILKNIIFLLLPSMSLAACPIYNSSDTQIINTNDGVNYLLENSPQCPTNVIEWNELIESSGLKHSPSMVANRGRNNPKLGSFSFFESVTGKIPSQNIVIQDGEIFYGHFTDKHQGKIILDQSVSEGKLLIELIAWDYKKEAFNFYELRGIGQSKVKWFYRGDSFDALKDNQYLYRNNGNEPKFGNRMRCSACHNSGGPIMKELKFPHNDWWTTKRTLLFGEAELDENLKLYIKLLVPAEQFATKIKTGIKKLEASFKYQEVKSGLSLQEQLRPLFCEQEINLESDSLPNTDKSKISIPSDFFINPIIGHKRLSLSRDEYEGLLKKYRLKFPETDNLDSDHAWLTPVKGYSDLLAIQTLVDKKIVSSYFVKYILSIDVQNPLFSEKRCTLLKKVPSQASKNWEKIFLSNIAKNEDNAQKTEFESFFARLIQLRKKVYSSEISQNPKGQILEPGFRVIFPVKKNSYDFIFF